MKIEAAQETIPVKEESSQKVKRKRDKKAAEKGKDDDYRVKDDLYEKAKTVIIEDYKLEKVKSKKEKVKTNRIGKNHEKDLDRLISAVDKAEKINKIGNFIDS